MTCPVCSTANPEGAAFCMGCGKALSTTCASCGAELPTSAAFCPACGTKVDSATGPAAGAPLPPHRPTTACGVMSRQNCSPSSSMPPRAADVAASIAADMQDETLRTAFAESVEDRLV